MRESRSRHTPASAAETGDAAEALTVGPGGSEAWTGARGQVACREEYHSGATCSRSEAPGGLSGDAVHSRQYVTQLGTEREARAPHGTPRAPGGRSVYAVHPERLGVGARSEAPGLGTSRAVSILKTLLLQLPWRRPGRSWAGTGVGPLVRTLTVVL